MEENKGSRREEQTQEDFQIQDQEVFQEQKVDSDSQSNEQLQKNESPTRNVTNQDLLPGNKTNEISSAEKERLQQGTDLNNIVKQKAEGSIENSMEMQQERETPGNVSETLKEGGADQYQSQGQEPKKELELRSILADFFSQYQFNQQDTKISHRKEAQSSNNSEEMGPLLPAEIVMCGKPEGSKNDCQREIKENLTDCHLESEEGLHAISQALKEDANVCHPETKEGQILENGATFPSSEHGAEPERPQSLKDYVALPFHRRESDETASRLQKLNSHLSVHHQKTKDYVTLPIRDSVKTAQSSQTKNYVTFPPRRLDDETEHTKISRSFSRSSNSKIYVTKQPPKQLPDPPTHVLLRVRRFQEKTAGPGTSTQAPVPPQSLRRTVSAPGSSTQEQVLPPSLQETASGSESKVHPRLPLGAQQLNERRESPQHARILQSQGSLSVPEDDDLPLVQFEEESSEAAVKDTNEPGVRRNRIIGKLIPPLSTGIQDFVQRFCERHIQADRQAFCKKLFVGCMILFFCLLISGIISVSLYLCGILVKTRTHTVCSNVTSPLYDSCLNLSITVTDEKQYQQSESLDDKVNILGTPLAIIMADSNANFTTPTVGFDINITNSLAEITPVMINWKDNVNTLEINSESNMATLVTNSYVNLINFDFGVTTPVDDFDVQVITPETDFDFYFINPVTDMSFNSTPCATV